eukprot:TRINITY_DN6346_c0_g1_i1.p1 TRINITY_DN6346_c0_g1~~TRINITY_DN6346_c0_g1_i1.p1  ORF type:complete len:103 (-),score=27.29 TRINITY_DN6346_c0_g1_i1:300-608(-)
MSKPVKKKEDFTTYFDMYNNPKGKKNKYYIEFNDDSRREYVLGFNKRKNARRKAFAEDERNKLREERRQNRKMKKLHMQNVLERMRKAEQVHIIDSEIKSGK